VIREPQRQGKIQRKIYDQHETDTLTDQIESNPNIPNHQNNHNPSSNTSLQVNIQPNKQPNTGKFQNFSFQHSDSQNSTPSAPRGTNDDPTFQNSPPSTSTSTSTYCDPLLEQFFSEDSTTSGLHPGTSKRCSIHNKHVFESLSDSSTKYFTLSNSSYTSNNTSTTVAYSPEQSVNHNLEKQLRQKLMRQQLIKQHSNTSTTLQHSTQNNDLVSQPDSQLSTISDEFDLDELLPVKTRSIQKENYLPCYTPRTLLYNVLHEHFLSLACLGYVNNNINEDTKNIVRQCIIHAIEYIKNDPTNANNYKPFLLIGPLLFIDSNKKNGTSLGSLVSRCENFLNDQWKFTVDIGKFKGRFYTPKKQTGTVIIPVDQHQIQSRTVRNKNIVSRLMQNDLRGAVQSLISGKFQKPTYEQADACLNVNIKRRIDPDHFLFADPSENYLNYGGRIGNKRLSATEVIKTFENLNTHSHSGPDCISSSIYRSLCGFNTENYDLNSVGTYIEQLTYLMNTVYVDPICPLQITQIMSSAEGVAIQQSLTKTRGISMVNDLRKAAESANLSSEIPHIKQILDHVNFGVFQKSGVDIIVHVKRIYHEINPHLNLVITDYKDSPYSY
jgi:hypothetical protein